MMDNDISLLIFQPTTSWIAPKTDWVSTDFYNAEDYNRQVNNLEVLKEYCNFLYPDKTISDMPAADKTYTSMIYASEINTIIARIKELNVYGFSFSLNTTYADNGNTPTYAEWNRIEDAELRLYETMKAQNESMSVLEFRLGGQKGIRV